MKVTKYTKPIHTFGGTSFRWEGMFNDLNSCLPKCGEVFCPNGLSGKRYLVTSTEILTDFPNENGDSYAYINCKPIRPAKLTPGCLQVDTSKFDEALNRMWGRLRPVPVDYTWTPPSRKYYGLENGLIHEFDTKSARDFACSGPVPITRKEAACLMAEGCDILGRL